MRLALAVETGLVAGMQVRGLRGRARMLVLGALAWRVFTTWRADESADGIERLTQAICSATYFGRRDVGNQRISRCAADAFA